MKNSPSMRGARSDGGKTVVNLTSRGLSVLSRFGEFQIYLRPKAQDLRPNVHGGRGKNRPAVVVQCDQNNRRLQNTVVVMITGNVQRVQSESTQFLVDPSTADGQSWIPWQSVFTQSTRYMVMT